MLFTASKRRGRRETVTIRICRTVKEIVVTEIVAVLAVLAVLAFFDWKAGTSSPAACSSFPRVGFYSASLMGGCEKSCAA